MTLNLLPGPEGWQLCRCEAEQIEPIAPFPLSGGLMWCWSHTRSHLMAVDQERKRVHAYRLEGEEFTRIMSPSTLPKDVKAHCIAMKGDQVYVGAQSVWLPRGQREWEQILMPEFARGEKKRLDGLILSGDRLIAVDDLMFPKFNLEYDIRDPGNPVFIGHKELRANTTYERIYWAAGGRRWFITLSNGINHGNEASFCTVFDIETLDRAWVYTFHSWRQGVHTPIHLRRALFLGDRLCMLADHEEGPILHWLDLSEAVLPTPLKRKHRSELTPEEWAARKKSNKIIRERRGRNRSSMGPKLLEIPITGFENIRHITACGSAKGLYLSGPATDGEPRILWQPIPEFPTGPETEQFSWSAH